MRRPLPHSNDDKMDKKDKLLERAWGYAELGMGKEAIVECEELVRLYPDDPSSFIELGLYCEENGEIDKAIGYYKYAIKIFPKYSYLYLSLGYCFEKHKKRNDMAMVCYEKALQLNPYEEWALNNTASILQAEGKWKEAVLFYEKSYEACKRSGIAVGQIMHNLAWAYYRIKNYKKALSIFNILVEHCPDYDNGSVYSDFGCVNYKMGNYREALKLLEKGLSLYPDSKRCQKLYRVVDKKIK